MDDSLRTAFQHTRLVTDEQTYCMVHLPRQAIVAAAAVIASEAEPFSALIADKDEVTLILAEDAFAEYAARLPENQVQAGYRLLTFDIVLDHTVIGYLAQISAALAAAGIPLMAFSAYERDHLLIQDTHFEAAVQVLEKLIAG